MYTINKSKMSMLSAVVIIALTSSLFLSAEAIRCHQCNSHLDEDCYALRLNTPRAPLDTQYLKDCDNLSEGEAFCRKTTLQIESTGEKRIVRGCGYMQEPVGRNNLSCYDADNEGYFQKICSCYTDGCNAAPATLQPSTGLILGLGAFMCVRLLKRLSRSDC